MVGALGRDVVDRTGSRATPPADRPSPQWDRAWPGRPRPFLGQPLGRPQEEPLGRLVILVDRATVCPRELVGVGDDGGEHGLQLQRRADRAADLAERRAAPRPTARAPCASARGTGARSRWRSPPGRRRSAAARSACPRRADLQAENSDRADRRALAEQGDRRGSSAIRGCCVVLRRVGTRSSRIRPRRRARGSAPVHGAPGRRRAAVMARLSSRPRAWHDTASRPPREADRLHRKIWRRWRRRVARRSRTTASRTGWMSVGELRSRAGSPPSPSAARAPRSARGCARRPSAPGSAYDSWSCAGHAVELLGQRLQLVAGAHVDALVERARPDPRRARLERPDRRHHAPGEHEAGQQRRGRGRAASRTAVRYERRVQRREASASGSSTKTSQPSGGSAPRR